jgi:type IV pilus assembly protein PilA
MNAMVTKNFKKKNKKNKGFTLVELIIVIAIIAILGVILAPQYIKYVDKSRWSTDQNNAKTLLKEVQTAVVDVQEQEKDPLAEGKTSATITMNDSKTEPKDISTDLEKSLNEADKNWKTTKVTNKGKAKGAKSTFTIKIDKDNQVTGAWN